MTQKKWQLFERQVKETFQLKGFDPVPDIIFAGRQHDIVLCPNDESAQPILIECKYHEKQSQRVSVVEVNNFVSTVIRLRTNGDISTGYLITNTDFTGTAKGALVGRPEEKFVLLRTISELRRGLVNFDRYIIRNIAKYEASEMYKMYEPLNAIERGKNKSIDLLETLSIFTNSKSSLLLLTGDYGTGKTTACQRFCYQLSSDLSQGKQVRIPIFIPLKWYAQCGGAIGLLQRFLNEHGLRHANVDALLSMHAAGQLILILDGFDEMLRRSTLQTRRETLQDLVELCIPLSKIILSGRPSYFNDEIEFAGPFRGVGITGARDRIRKLPNVDSLNNNEKWEHYKVTPFETDQILSFLSKRSPFKTDTARKKHAKKIIEVIKSTYNLSDLAKRPILLDMIGQTIRSGKISEVQNPASLYNMYVETWLQIDADKGAFRSLISPEDRLSFSIALAWVFYDQNIQEIHWTELQSLVGEYFNLDEIDDIDHFGSDVRTCTFLTRDDEGYFKFAHLSFQEYFCARFLVNTDVKLKQALHSISFEPKISIYDIWESSPRILHFVSDLLNCPVSPEFWSYVEKSLADNIETFSMNSKKNNTIIKMENSLHNMLLEMVGGESMVFELHDLAAAYRDPYHEFCSYIEILGDKFPNTSWITELSEALKMKRLP